MSRDSLSLARIHTFPSICPHQTHARTHARPSLTSKESQRLMVNFVDYPTVLLRMLNQVFHSFIPPLHGFCTSSGTTSPEVEFNCILNKPIFSLKPVVLFFIDGHRSHLGASCCNIVHTSIHPPHMTHLPPPYIHTVCQGAPHQPGGARHAAQWRGQDGLHPGAIEGGRMGVDQQMWIDRFTLLSRS